MLDIAANTRIMTLASSNDVATLDKAAIRIGGFDAVVEVGYPSRVDAGRILDAMLTGSSGADAIGRGTVVAALPDQTTGSDLREIIRRAILSSDETVSSHQQLCWPRSAAAATVQRRQKACTYEQHRRRHSGTDRC